MKPHLKIETHPLANPENIVQGDCYRITVLTPSMVRLEYSPEGHFTDEATQSILNRDFPRVDFTYRDTEGELEIRTDYFQLNYDKKEFSSKGLSCLALKVEAEGASGWNRTPWRYGEKVPTLKGTTRTLDTVDGACELDEGIMSVFQGVACVDDSKSLLLGEDGWVSPRKGAGKDIYLFAYGFRYREALKDFYFLCGKTPMLPRFVLGNWWSRYYKYTEESYMELMERFDREGIPFTVAVIDMDWHLVDIDPKYGSGWTGYTWNREMFPDPARFLKKLHDRAMHTTLNVHPADGVRAFEDCYPQVAQAMGADQEKEEPVNFDIADPKFLEVYFEKIHHPMEDEGVDFWWLDWQQGTNTKVEGLDPLWMLNHYHFLDSAREGKRPMTFSRYAGVGSHRYPVGFSGDTVISWESLAFQPYFTNTASNIGYGWWSHDIGGHMQGTRDDELEARWYQYGVFAPINRLHSTQNEYIVKEPWRFRKEVCETMKEFLRLRHRMVPYLYTMNYRAWKEDLPICQPLYYEYPGKREAYLCKNQYFFGSELMVAPITAPSVPRLNMAQVKAYLPKGLWFDLFTDLAYEGDRSLCMYRAIDKIPVLAKAGAILPMTEQFGAGEAVSNPSELAIQVYPGADNTFTLYEDDNVSTEYEKGVCAKTNMRLDWSGRRFVIEPVEGDKSLIPGERRFKVVFHKISAKTVTVTIGGALQPVDAKWCGTTLTVTLPLVTPGEQVEILFEDGIRIADNPVEEMVAEILNRAEIQFEQKDRIDEIVRRDKNRPAALFGELQALGVSGELCGAIMEITGAQE